MKKQQEIRILENQVLIMATLSALAKGLDLSIAKDVAEILDKRMKTMFDYMYRNLK